MKRKIEMTITIALMIMSIGGLFIKNAEAGNSLKVAVSCTIPSLLEMNLQPNNIESSKAEINETQERICVQQEDPDVTYESEASEFISDSQSENQMVLYSFYER